MLSIKLIAFFYLLTLSNILCDTEFIVQDDPEDDVSEPPRKSNEQSTKEEDDVDVDAILLGDFHSWLSTNGINRDFVERRIYKYYHNYLLIR
jgi:hypothetical protein